MLLAARAARLADRTDNIFGDRFTAALVKHFADPIVDAIKRPITVAVLDEVVDVMKKGTYAANMRRAIDENRAELEAMILDLIKQDRTAGRLRFVPFHERAVVKAPRQSQAISFKNCWRLARIAACATFAIGRY